VTQNPASPKSNPPAGNPSNNSPSKSTPTTGNGSKSNGSGSNSPKTSATSGGPSQPDSSKNGASKTTSTSGQPSKKRAAEPAPNVEAKQASAPKPAPPPSPVTVLVKPKPSSWFSLTRSFVWIAVVAAIWGVLTHLAIVHITQQIPVLASQTVLTQVEPLIENAFHAVIAWDRLQEGQDGFQDRTLRQRYGHLPYAELAPEQLIVIGSYTTLDEQRFERMQEAAALALLHMIDEARRDGVWLVPISGFRDYQRQSWLFQSQTEQMGAEEWAARTVAPPGYSEHHTGLAVDLADGMARAMDLSQSFGQTEAFRWLSRHGSDFGFELSFPPDNAQGVSYEPWHWRFVGAPEAEQIFAQGRSLLDLDRDLNYRR